MWLADETFKSVIQHTPLISIDLIVRNENGEVLLGKRINAPAKGDWFVPGGRVRKNETLDDAFFRLVKEELGIESGIIRKDAKFLGVFEHFYDDCVFGDDVSTHYVVLAYEIYTEKFKINKISKLQHVDYLFLKKDSVLNDGRIHKYNYIYL